MTDQLLTRQKQITVVGLGRTENDCLTVLKQTPGLTGVDYYWRL